MRRLDTPTAVLEIQQDRGTALSTSESKHSMGMNSVGSSLQECGAFRLARVAGSEKTVLPGMLAQCRLAAIAGTVLPKV